MADRLACRFPIFRTALGCFYPNVLDNAGAYTGLFFDKTGRGLGLSPISGPLSLKPMTGSEALRNEQKDVYANASDTVGFAVNAVTDRSSNTSRLSHLSRAVNLSKNIGVIRHGSSFMVVDSRY